MAGGAENGIKGLAPPSGLAGVMGDTIMARTGLTPQYSGPETNGVGNEQSVGGAASPFSSMVGQGGNFMGLDGVSGDIDWSAWDNYIANNSAIDPGNMWPMNLDLDSMGTPANEQAQQATANTANAGVFMGAATPGANGKAM